MTWASDGAKGPMTKEDWNNSMVGKGSMVYPYDNGHNWGVHYAPCTPEHWVAGTAVLATTKKDPQNEGFSSTT